ncbi:UDP-N-acetylglucosamine--N-acetylmuramyl-(pentapeptide) pyrophosphoryl-undecaprenol N-acetylglucosamine transferase [subsurface metagenome]
MEPTQGNPLIIRADASTQIGTGHLMRCLALGQAWKDADGRVTLITACQNKDLLQRLKEEGFDLHPLACPYPDPSDWDYTKDILAAHPNAWVVLDGYHFDEVYQQWVKEVGHRLLVIDSAAHLKHYFADIVLNPYLHAEQLHYSCEPYTRLLLGTSYVLLRREFLAWKDWKREIPKLATRVLVTLGGSDPENITLKVIQALQKIDVPGLEATVVIGASNPHADTLKATAGQSRVPIHLIHNAPNMMELIAQADLAITAGGITPWEMCFMGLPMLIMVTADNQRANVQTMHQAGIAENLGWHKDVDEGKIAGQLKAMINSQGLRQSMSCAQRKMVDGLGPERVLLKMKES